MLNAKTQRRKDAGEETGNDNGEQESRFVIFLMALIFTPHIIGEKCRRAWNRVVWWFTTSVQCSWCGKMKHRALFHGPVFSHTICRKCFKRETEGLRLEEHSRAPGLEIRRGILAKLVNELQNGGRS